MLRPIVTTFTHHFGDFIVSFSISRIADTAHNGRTRNAARYQPKKKNIYSIFPVFSVVANVDNLHSCVCVYV